MAERSRYCTLTACTVALVGCSLLAPDDEHFLSGNGAGGAGGQGGTESVCTPAPPCTTPVGGATVSVSPAQASELAAIVAGAAAGTTVSLSAGTYPISAVLSFKKEGVTLTSSSGVPGDVVIDGGAVPVLIAIGASDVTIRGITIRGGAESAILIGGGASSIVERPRLCRVQVEDGGMSFVQAPVEAGFSDCGRIETSELVLTAAGRATHCPSGLISGVSVQGGRGWVLTGTTFRDFYCASPDPPASAADCGTPGVAAVFSAGARDTVVENNRFLDVTRALALGYTVTTTSPRTRKTPSPNTTPAAPPK